MNLCFSFMRDISKQYSGVRDRRCPKQSIIFWKRTPIHFCCIWCVCILVSVGSQNYIAAPPSPLHPPTPLMSYIINYLSNSSFLQFFLYKLLHCFQLLHDYSKEMELLENSQKLCTNWHCFLRNTFSFKKYILLILVDTLCFSCLLINSEPLNLKSVFPPSETF